MHNLQSSNQFKSSSLQWFQCLCSRVPWMTAVTLLCSQHTIWFEADDCWLCRSRWWWWGAVRWAWLDTPRLPCRGHVAVLSHRSDRIPGDRMTTTPSLEDFLSNSQAWKGSNKGLNYTHVCTSCWCSRSFSFWLIQHYLRFSSVWSCVAGIHFKIKLKGWQKLINNLKYNIKWYFHVPQRSGDLKKLCLSMIK